MINIFIDRKVFDSKKGVLNKGQERINFSDPGKKLGSTSRR